MYKITLVSTVHLEIGKCNADELCNILENINPEVIFLEALDGTYSDYDRMLFSTFGVNHKKLEIKAIQKYCLNNSCKYIPVLDNELSDSFDKKYDKIIQFREIQESIDTFNSMASEYGFKFLNSLECINHQDQMRKLESKLSNNPASELDFYLGIDEYENSMIRNIYKYCENNQFISAIFMCGVAHRKSIIEKIDRFNAQEQVNINWVVYEN